MKRGHLGDRVREAREAAGEGLGEDVTQREVGRLAGLPDSTVSNLEGGKKLDCRLETTLKPLARVLGAKIGWLAAGEGECPTPQEASAAFAAARTSGAQRAERANERRRLGQKLRRGRS